MTRANSNTNRGDATKRTRSVSKTEQSSKRKGSGGEIMATRSGKRSIGTQPSTTKSVRTTRSTKGPNIPDAPKSLMSDKRSIRTLNEGPTKPEKKKAAPKVTQVIGSSIVDHKPQDNPNDNKHLSRAERSQRRGGTKKADKQPPNPEILAAQEANKSKNNPSGKNYFNVGEDYQLFYNHSLQSGLFTLTQIAQELSCKLERSVESIRDRLKRYIVKLSAEDEIKIMEAARSNPDSHVHWKINVEKGTKEVDHISAKAPGLMTQLLLGERPDYEPKVKDPNQLKVTKR
jgi:hypothetical protein